MDEAARHRLTRLGGNCNLLSPEFQYDFAQFRLLADLLIKVLGFTCIKPLKFQQQVAAAVEDFLSAFPVRRIWWLIRALKYHSDKEHFVTGPKPEDRIVDAYFVHGEHEKANREMLRATGAIKSLCHTLKHRLYAR